jgi:hypothetical protein
MGFNKYELQVGSANIWSPTSSAQMMNDERRKSIINALDERRKSINALDERRKSINYLNV